MMLLSSWHLLKWEEHLSGNVPQPIFQLLASINPGFGLESLAWNCPDVLHGSLGLKIRKFFKLTCCTSQWSRIHTRLFRLWPSFWSLDGKCAGRRKGLSIKFKARNIKVKANVRCRISTYLKLQLFKQLLPLAIWSERNGWILEIKHCQRHNVPNALTHSALVSSRTLFISSSYCLKTAKYLLFGSFQESHSRSDLQVGCHREKFYIAGLLSHNVFGNH